MKPKRQSHPVFTEDLPGDDIGLREHVRELQTDLDQTQYELSFMHAFLGTKNLEEEYSFFRENACEVYDSDHPFPRITL